jgi:PAS domain S-box-containing protein
MMSMADTRTINADTEPLSMAADEPAEDRSEANRHDEVVEFARRVNSLGHAKAMIQDAVDLLADAFRAEYKGIAEIAARGSKSVLTISATDDQGQPDFPKSCETLLESDGSQKPSSMIACALKTGGIVVTSDLAEEKRFSDQFLCKLGFASAISVPLLLEANPIGALCVFSKEAGAFQPADLWFAETIAQLLASAISRKKVEDELQVQRELNAVVLSMVDELLFTLDVHGNLTSMNAHGENITGFSLGEIEGRHFSSVFIAPRELALFESAFRKATTEKTEGKFLCHLLTKHGEKKQISWTIRPICFKDNTAGSIVFRGVETSEEGGMQSRSPDARYLNAETEADPENTQPASPDGSEKRSSPRRPFRYRQSIAPIMGDAFPNPADFFQVECLDLSAGGISFYLDAAPTFETLIVAVGKEPGVKYFKAQVVRVTEKTRNGRKIHVVGCRFTGNANDTFADQ